MNGSPLWLPFVFAFTLLAPSALFADEIKTLNPETLAAPFKNRFSHGKLVPSEAEWLYTAGRPVQPSELRR